MQDVQLCRDSGHGHERLECLLTSGHVTAEDKTAALIKAHYNAITSPAPPVSHHHAPPAVSADPRPGHRPGRRPAAPRPAVRHLHRRGHRPGRVDHLRLGDGRYHQLRRGGEYRL